MQRDRRFLKKLAATVQGQLQQRHLGLPFRLAPKVRVRETNSDGWAATLGNFMGYRTTAEVWIDRFTGHPTRKVYYTLTASQGEGLARLAKEARRELGKHLSLYHSDWDEESDQSRLAKRLAKSRFGHPVYERYPANKEYFYGVYEFDRTGLQRNAFNRLAERATDFFQTITELVAHDAPVSDYDTYRTVENRQSVARHIRRERKSHVATLRKQHDNYICEICRFDFRKVYGELGDDFAEAHHLTPLHKNSAVRCTTVDDLITVCANCHRMLHRMDGKPGDVRRLKQLVKRR
jgi:hypothetical protein